MKAPKEQSDQCLSLFAFPPGSFRHVTTALKTKMFNFRTVTLMLLGIPIFSSPV